MSELNERQQGLIDELKDKFIAMNPDGKNKGSILNIGEILSEVEALDQELLEIKEYNKTFLEEAKQRVGKEMELLAKDFRALGLDVEVSVLHDKLSVVYVRNGKGIALSIIPSISKTYHSNARGSTDKYERVIYQRGNSYMRNSLEKLLDTKEVKNSIIRLINTQKQKS